MHHVQRGERRRDGRRLTGLGHADFTQLAVANGIEAADVQHVTTLPRVLEHAFRSGRCRLIEMGQIRLRPSELRCAEMRNVAATPFPIRF